MKLLYIALAPLILCVVGMLTAPAPTECPEGCICFSSVPNTLDVKCHSFASLTTNLPKKLARTIKSVRITGSHDFLERLRHLTNMKSLYLPSNNIKYISADFLPMSINKIDVSNNSITFLSEDLTLLPNLKTLILDNNPISCTCPTLNVVHELIKKGVSLGANTKCNSPPSNKGQQINSAVCHSARIIDDIMQGDAPYEFEGSGEVVESRQLDEHGTETIEEEFLLGEKHSSTESHTTSEITEGPVEEVEGSGEPVILVKKVPVVESVPEINTTGSDDYGEDYNEREVNSTSQNASEVEVPSIKACNFDCSTASPLVPNNDTDVAPAPGLFEGAKMIWNDLFGITEATTVEIQTTLVAEHVTESIVVVTPANPTTARQSFDNRSDKVVAAIDKKSDSESKSYSTYIFLGALFLLVSALVFYAIYQRRSSRKKSRENSPKKPEITPEEMQLLERLVTESVKPNGNHAFSDGNLSINGGGKKEHYHHYRNPRGSTINDEPEPELETELEPELGRDAANEVPPENASPEKDKLLPDSEAKRVTVKASEIPDSTPKTPLLVTRHLDSDGTVISTPSTSGRNLRIK